MKYTQTYTVPFDEFTQIEEWLASGKQVPDVRRDEKLFDATIVFHSVTVPAGQENEGETAGVTCITLEMDIRVYNATTEGGGPWCEGVLFEDGNEVDCTQVSDTLKVEFIVPFGEHELVGIIQCGARNDVNIKR